MTTFDQRKQGYEAGYVHDQDSAFRAEMRRDRLLGEWAGARMGLSGDALKTYAASVVRADLKEPGDNDVFDKVMADLTAKGVPVPPADLRARMDQLLDAARTDLRAGR